jgi:hypothetical protein
VVWDFAQEVMLKLTSAFAVSVADAMYECCVWGSIQGRGPLSSSLDADVVVVAPCDPLTNCAPPTPFPLSIASGYWGKPDKTAEVFFKDGGGKLWFRSGDIGRMDADDYVYILDRYAAMGGWRVIVNVNELR